MKTITSAEAVAKAFDFEDGRTTQVAYLDGYAFGDRLLENVIFRCELLPDRRLQVSVTPRCQKYFEKLNQKTWLQAALTYAIGTDTFCETETGHGEDLGYVDPVLNPSHKGAAFADA